MANVYVVEKDIFFGNKRGGFSLDDIKIFSNKEKAIEFVEKEIKDVKPKFDKYDYQYDMCKDMLIYSQNECNENGVKHTFRIFKNKIN